MTYSEPNSSYFRIINWMKRIFYHTGSLLFSIPLALAAIGVVFVGPRGWFFSLLLLFGALYLSGAWRAIEVDKKARKIKRIKGFLWFSAGDWENIDHYDKILVGPETHRSAPGFITKGNMHHTSFNIYLVNKSGIRYTIEKMKDSRKAVKSGAYYARTMGLKYDHKNFEKGEVR